MDSRERVLTAVARRRPDRVPADLWVSAGFLRRLQAETGLTAEVLYQRGGIDLGYLPGPAYCGPPLTGAAGERVDLWGVPRAVAEVAVAGGTERYEEVTKPPLASAGSVEEVLDYQHWPSPDWFDYGGLPAQCEAVLARGRAVVFMGDRLNRIAQLKPALYLRGMEQLLVDMVLQPELVEALLGRVRAFYLGYLERLLEAARGRIDIVLTGDDFGAQQGLLISLPMWDRYLRAGFTSYVELAHGGGARVMHHTCGAVRTLVPRLIECGLDVLQSLQPEARGMAVAELEAAFGDRLAFHGGLSVQQLLPFGSPEQIRAEVCRLAETGRRGGYILGTSHNVQADVPVPNVLAMLDAYREFARQ